MKPCLLAAAAVLLIFAAGGIGTREQASANAEDISAAGPSEPSSGSANGESRDADLAEFDAAIESARGLMKQMFEQMIRWHTGALEESKSAARLRRIDLEQQMRHAIEEAVRAATEIVAKDPQAHPEVTVFLLESVLYRGEKDWYEHTGPAAAALLSGSGPVEDLIGQVGRGRIARIAGLSFFAMSDFDRAEPYLQEAAEAGTLEDREFAYVEMLDQYRESWQREQELRAEDAEAGDLPRVRFRTTRGDVVVELFEDQAPVTVNNFVALVDQGFYQNMPFYQVISGVMALTGDPLGDGTGNAGYTIPDEASHPEARPIFRGSLAMAKLPNPAARSGAPRTIPDSASSQFFFSYLPLPGADEEHTVFGRVVEGIDALSALNRLDPTSEEKDAPQVQPDMLLSAEVLQRRDHPYQPPANAPQTPAAAAGAPAPID